MAYTSLVAGTTITATWANTNVRDQGVSLFASTAARDAAITAPTEGLVTYQTDTNTITTYSGSVWSTIGPVSGALTSFTPTITQSVGVTFTNTGSTYQRVGRRITAKCQVTLTGAGTAGAVIVGTLPVTAVTAMDGSPIGTGYFSDASTGFTYHGFAVQANSGTAVYLVFPILNNSDASQRIGSGSVTVAVANADGFGFNVTYEAAGDA